MRVFFLTLLILLPGLSQATIDAYEFSDEQYEKRFHELTGELRLSPSARTRILRILMLRWRRTCDVKCTACWNRGSLMKASSILW